MGKNRNRRVYFLILITFVLLLSGCGSKPSVGDDNGTGNGGNGGGGGTISGSINNSYVTGRVWTYRERDTEANTAETYTVKVVGPATFHGVAATQVDSSYNDGSKDKTYWDFSDELKMRLLGSVVSEGGETYETSFLPNGISMPASFTQGAKFTSQYSQELKDPDTGDVFGQYEYTIAVEILGVTQESVTVPAGTYSAVKVHARTTTVSKFTDSSGMMDPITHTYSDDSYSWYAGVGMVKEQDVEGEFVTELMSVTG